MRQGRAKEDAAHGVANDGVRAGIGEALQPGDQACDNRVVSLGHCRVPELPGAIAPSAKLANQEKERKRRAPEPVDQEQVHSSILHQHPHLYTLMTRTTTFSTTHLCTLERTPGWQVTQ